ncbi:MAG: GxxExxY protein, partial [Chloroflexi bacterium]|nr:GxxExxY protein [Chloroflexota bacterium]
MTNQQVKPEYPHSELTGKIIAAAQEVHRTLGPGFEEVFYQRAMSKELQTSGQEHAREVWIDVFYKGEKLGRKRVDFVVEVCMVETKAKAVVEDVDYIQTLSYLKASSYEVGLLVNFGGPKLEVKRLLGGSRFDPYQLWRREAHMNYSKTSGRILRLGAAVLLISGCAAPMPIRATDTPTATATGEVAQVEFFSQPGKFTVRFPMFQSLHEAVAARTMFDEPIG